MDAEELDINYEDEASEEEYDGEGVQEEEVIPEIKPELKRLYQQHPECNLDYIEQVIPKIPLQFIPPGGDKADSNHRTYPFLTNFERTKIIGLRANKRAV
mgnify:CR=1 FL=1